MVFNELSTSLVELAAAALVVLLACLAAWVRRKRKDCAPQPPGRIEHPQQPELPLPPPAPRPESVEEEEEEPEPEPLEPHKLDLWRLAYGGTVAAPTYRRRRRRRMAR